MKPDIEGRTDAREGTDQTKASHHKSTLSAPSQKKSSNVL